MSMEMTENKDSTHILLVTLTASDGDLECISWGFVRIA